MPVMIKILDIQNLSEEEAELERESCLQLSDRDAKTTHSSQRKRIFLTTTNILLAISNIWKIPIDEKLLARCR